MNHPEILIAPALMFADLILTLVASRMHSPIPERRAAYELNPRFKAAIGRGDILYPRHLAATLAVTAALYLTSAILDGEFLPYMLGLVVGVYVCINGVHASNILTILIARKQQHAPPGQTPSLRKHRLLVSACSYFGMAALPVAALALYERSGFALAMAGGALFAAAMPLAWARDLPDFLPAGTQDETGELALICAFCGFAPPQGRALIAGRTAMICDECVETSAEALRQQKPAGSFKNSAEVASA